VPPYMGQIGPEAQGRKDARRVEAGKSSLACHGREPRLAELPTKGAPERTPDVMEDLLGATSVRAETAAAEAGWRGCSR